MHSVVLYVLEVFVCPCAVDLENPKHLKILTNPFLQNFRHTTDILTG